MSILIFNRASAHKLSKINMTNLKATHSLITDVGRPLEFPQGAGLVQEQDWRWSDAYPKRRCALFRNYKGSKMLLYEDEVRARPNLEQQADVEVETYNERTIYRKALRDFVARLTLGVVALVIVYLLLTAL